MAPAPAAVFSTVGHRAVMKITQMAAWLLSRRTTSQTGNQANGLTGRSICTMGLMAIQARRLAPMNRPSGIPTAEARKKPIPTRWREKASWRPMPLSFGPRS